MMNMQQNNNQQLNEIWNELFENRNVRIYGSFEKPYFYSNDIGEILEYVAIRNTVSKFDEGIDFLRGYQIDAPSNIQPLTIFLTDVLP